MEAPKESGHARDVRLYWQRGCKQNRDHEGLGPWTSVLPELYFSAQKKCEGIRAQ